MAPSGSMKLCKVVEIAVAVDPRSDFPFGPIGRTVDATARGVEAMRVWPSGPHLSVFVFTRQHALTSLAKLADFLQDEGCPFTGRGVLTAPGAGDQASGDEVAVEGSASAWLSSLEGSGRTATSLAFRCPKVGPVALRLASSTTAQDPNPLEICCQASGLSIPAQFRTAGEHHRGKALVSWSEHLVRQMLTTVEGEYAAIGIKAELPTPSQLNSLEPDDPLLPHTWLVPSEISDELISTLDPLTGASDPTKMAHALRSVRASAG
jgi:hypothetical protein